MKPNISGNRDHVIAMIYRAAADPAYWPDLLEQLYALAYELPEQGTDAPQLSQVISSISDEIKVAKENSASFYLLEHFNQALNITKQIHQLEQQNNSLSALLDQVPVGVILVNEQAEVIHCNEPASSCLEQHQHLDINNGILVAKARKHNDELHQKISELSLEQTASSWGLPLNNPSETSPQALAILSPIQQMSAQFKHSNATVVVFLSPKQEQGEWNLRLFNEAYSLSKKEASIVQHLLNGSSPKQIAEDTHVSYNTVRSQLKAVFRKTGTNKQSDLVNLVLTGPSGMLAATQEEMSSDDITPHFIHLGDGRKLCYIDLGDPQGAPLVYCHSILGCRIEWVDQIIPLLKPLGLRLISIDRPGFGQSDPAKTYGFKQWGDDVAETLSQLGLSSASMLGYATGGVYAASVAGYRPDIVEQLFVLSSGDAPTHPDDLAKTNTMYRMHMTLARDFPKIHYLFTSILEKSLNKQPDRLFKVLSKDMQGKDIEKLGDPEFRAMFIRYLYESKRQGGRAFSQDLCRIMAPWDFNLKEVKCPALFLHGEQDKQIPPHLAERAVSVIEDAQYHCYSQQGHMMIYECGEDVLQRCALALGTITQK